MIYQREIDNISYCSKCQTFVGDLVDLKYPLVINWLITKNCNLKCRYCFATDIDNTNDISPDVLSYVLKSQYLKVVISGGEPFTNPLIWDVMRRLSAANKSIVVDTNGTHIFSDKEIALIKDNNIHLRISIDSANPTDNNRLRCSSTNHFENIVRNIELLSLCHGIEVDLQTVVTKRNIKNLSRLSELASRWNVKKWYLQPLLPSGRGENLAHLSPTIKSIYYESKNFPLNTKKFVIKDDENNKSVVLLNNFGKLITEDEKHNIEIGTVHDDSSIMENLDKNGHVKRYKLLPQCYCQV